MLLTSFVQNEGILHKESTQATVMAKMQIMVYIQMFQWPIWIGICIAMDAQILTS